jgi:hypothetical protein
LYILVKEPPMGLIVLHRLRFCLFNFLEPQFISFLEPFGPYTPKYAGNNVLGTIGTIRFPINMVFVIVVYKKKWMILPRSLG